MLKQENKRITKKAEMSSKMIVSLVLLITGFIIILSVFFSFDWESNTDAQVCHQSVLLRATSNQIVSMDLTQLNCKTQKHCLTSSLFFFFFESVFKGDDEVKKKRVSEIEEIQRFISDEVVDCWSMMGEGKVSVFSPSIAQKVGLGTVYSSCVVCSRIAFDEDLKISQNELKNLDLYDYMKKTKISGKEITYAEYFSDSQTVPDVGQGDEIKFSVPEVSKENGKTELKEGESVSISKEELKDLEEQNVPEELGIVFMQISAPTHKEAFSYVIKGAIGATAASFVSPGGKIARSLAVKACAGPVRGPICVATGILAIGAQQAQIYKSRNVAAGKCVDVYKGDPDGARNGCSVVRVVDYDSENLAEYCSVIESY